MSRRFVGTWADGLSSVTQGQAIAALGILARSTSPNLRLDTGEQISAALHAAQSESPVGARHLLWGMNNETAWDELKQRMKPELAAAGWEQFTGQLLPDLRVMSHYMTDAEAAETYRWLADLLWPVDVRVRSVLFEWWLNTAAGRRDWSRTAWHWPLRLGFLPDDDSQALLAQFHTTPSGWIRTLAQPIDVEHIGQSCDLLVSPLGLAETAGFLRRLKVSATAILMAGRGPMDTTAEAIESQKLSIAGNTAALAFFRKFSINTLVELIRHISHDRPFDIALREAVQESYDAPLVIADMPFIEVSHISRLGKLWAKRLDRRGARDSANRMRSVADTPYLSEGGAASDLIRLATSSGAREPESRFLKAATWLVGGRAPWLPLGPREVQPVSEFWAERWHLLTVSVGPLAAGETSELPPLDLRDIDRTEDKQRLKVAITAPGCDVLPVPADLPPEAASDPHTLSASLSDWWHSLLYRERERPGGTGAVDITIWSTGSSTVGAFLLKPRRLSRVKRILTFFSKRRRLSSFLKARILVLHANRILQTAILEGAVHGWSWQFRDIRVSLEGVIRSGLEDLNERRVFDLAFLINDTLTGVPQITAVSDGRVTLRDFDEIKDSAARIGNRLLEIIASPADFTQPDSPALRELMINLAHEGVLIRRALADAGLQPVIDLDPARLQVVTAKPDQVLPLEIVYDGLAPDRANAAICPNQAHALKRDSCADCPNRDGREHVCAMRFWGVRKVIERQMYNQRTAPEKSYVTAAAPSPLQECIGHAPIRLFATSVRAANFPGGPEAIRQLEARLKGLATDQVFAAQSWKEWRSYVQEHAPRLLVLVPHVDVSPAGEVLEIGANDTLTSADVDQTVVGSGGRVIVLLLGCETAAASVRYANFIAQFRHAKASIVVGTIMPVRGRHAAPIAAALIELLDQCWSEPFKVATMGDVMVLARRRFMAQGLPAGLALVAFGDADWLLGKE
jgi:hypothetical protein